MLRSPGCSPCTVGALILVLLAAIPAAAESTGSPWTLPGEGACAAARPPAAEDVAELPFSPGDRVPVERLELLRPFLAKDVWSVRTQLFAPGTHIEIGPCFRRYPPPAHFVEATARYAGRAKVLSGGGLEGVPAGLPFPAESIAVDDADAGTKWAWNAVRRYRGAGRWGEVRLTYIDAGQETAHLEGDHFVAWLLGRSDLPAPEHRPSWARRDRWVSGGRTRDPSSSYRCAFRHARRASAETGDDAPDDLFFRSSAMRRPSRVAWDPEFPLLTCAFQRGYYLPRGGRVARHRWRVAGVRDLLAPINVSTPAFPTDDARDFGPSGAALGADRWELRRTLTIEADGGSIRRTVDLETLFPLFHAEGGTQPSVVIVQTGRWSEDRVDYPAGADGSPVQVVDPAVRVLISPGSGEVVRIETYETRAVAPRGKVERRVISFSALERER